MLNPPPALWDIFCRVIDNHGDLGVCWRLARQLAARGHTVRLWVDDASALAWMAPGALQGACARIAVLPWRAPLAPPLPDARADVWVEAFGCDIPPEFIAHQVHLSAERTPVWINLEYLSAERQVERLHALPSPVLRGPAAGWTKWFYYPGFTPATGGLLREDDLPARQAAFDRPAWRRAHGLPARARAASLFCYEPPALPQLLMPTWPPAPPLHLLVTAGRATGAVRQAAPTHASASAGPRLHYLPYLPQTAYDELLWGCDLNFVRGEDSLVRALLAGQPLVWQLYPQHDGAHHAKLQAFLDWLEAPASLRDFHRAWNAGSAPPPLPAPDWAAWRQCIRAARARLLAQPDLASQLIRFVRSKQLPN